MTNYNDIIITPVYGPLNTSNTPNILGVHNLGSLSCSTPNPPLFYPSQEPVNSDQFINARRQYIQTVNNATNTKPILKFVLSNQLLKLNNQTKTKRNYEYQY